MKPTARKDLRVEKTENGLLLSDKKTGNQTELGRIMTMIWTRCDGVNSPWEIGNQIKESCGLDLDEDAIWHSLNELKRMNLLVDDDDDSLDRYAPYLQSDLLPEFLH